MTTKQVLTTFEAADMCHVSYNTIKNWIRRGLLNAYRTVGGHLRIDVDDLKTFCREQGIPINKDASPQHRKVLIVDDEETIRVALQDSLLNYPEKFDLYTASDGFEAGTLMQSVRPDVVILDLVMPGMDGFKVCQNIRRSPALKHAKIIVLTGFPSDRNLERASDLGADLCLTKPIERAALFDAIKSLTVPRGGVRVRNRKNVQR